MRQSLSIASDIRVGPRLMLEGSVGWFFASGRERAKEEVYNGVRLRAGFKYFTSHYASTGKSFMSPYIGIDSKYNFIREETYETVCRYGCQYEEMMLVSYTQEISGLAVKIGLHIIAGNKKRIILDMHTGLGYRVFHYYRGGLPQDAELSTRTGLFVPNLGRNVTPDFLMGMSLGYCFY